MEAKIITVTSKGQISLPIAMRRAMRFKEGERLIALVEGDTITLRKATADRLRTKKTDTVAHVTIRPVREFAHVLKGTNATWNKEHDGAYDKY